MPIAGIVTSNGPSTPMPQPLLPAPVKYAVALQGELAAYRASALLIAGPDGHLRQLTPVTRVGPGRYGFAILTRLTAATVEHLLYGELGDRHLLIANI